MFLSQHNFQDVWIPFSQQKYVQDDFVFLYDILPGRVEAASRVSGLCPGILRHPFGAPDEDQLDFYRGKELSGHQAGHADFSVRNSAKKLWVWGKSTRIYYGHPEWRTQRLSVLSNCRWALQYRGNGPTNRRWAPRWSPWRVLIGVLSDSLQSQLPVTVWVTLAVKS